MLAAVEISSGCRPVPGVVSIRGAPRLPRTPTMLHVHPAIIAASIMQQQCKKDDKTSHMGSGKSRCRPDECDCRRFAQRMLCSLSSCESCTVASHKTNGFMLGRGAKNFHGPGLLELINLITFPALSAVSPRLRVSLVAGGAVSVVCCQSGRRLARLADVGAVHPVHPSVPSRRSGGDVASVQRPALD